MIQFTYSPPLLALAGAALVGLLLFWWSYRSAKGRPPAPLRILLIGLRSLVIAAVVLCLLNPEWVEMLKHDQKSRVAVLLDTSKSMSIRDLPNGRLNTAREWLNKHVLSAAPAGLSLPVYTFDEQLHPPTGALNSASPTGSVTALSAALEQALVARAEDPLTGVILISDGIETDSKTPEDAARLYRRKGIPIHTVLVGTTNEMQDIILENVQVKRAVPNEAPTRLSLALRSPGYGEKMAAIQVRNQKEIVAAQEVKLNGASQKIEMEFTPRKKGFQVYEVVVQTLPGEWLTSNNRQMFGLEVVDPTIRVLYMEGTPQHPASPIPEWKYLKDALESDRNIKVTTLYRQFGNNGQFLNTVDADPETGERIYPVEHPTKGFPKTLAGLLEYDVIIHSDIKKESFSAAQLQNMAKLVEEYGGGFVMIGGNSAFGKGGYHRTILDRIIPVAMEKENDSLNTAMRIRVPRSAFAHPIMNIGSTPEETEAIWTKKFPYLYGFNRVDHAKPGAIVLGENPGYRNAYGPGLLLAVQEIGKGRSMAFASDTTRTWGRDFETIWGEPVRPGAPLSEQNCDNRYYRQFWVNAVRWLANGRVGRTNNPVTLELAQTHSKPGEKIAASIKVRDVTEKEIPNAEVTLTLVADSKTNATVRARYDSATHAYAAELSPTEAGNFLITAAARRNGVELGDDRQLLITETLDTEMADIRARPELMSLLARQTKGEALSLADANSASPGYIFAKAPPPIIEYRRTAFWDKPVWLSLILGLLALEWGVRRVRGLA